MVELKIREFWGSGFLGFWGPGFWGPGFWGSGFWGSRFCGLAHRGGILVVYAGLCFCLSWTTCLCTYASDAVSKSDAIYRFPRF